MARTNNLSNFLTDVSSAIKQKTGDNTPIPASDFDTEILSIETGGNYQSKTLNIAQNGNYNLLPDTGYDAISDVSISVSVSPILQNKTITENGSYTADQNYDGLGTVIVNVQGGTINNQDKTITQNGAYTADSGYTGLGTVTVNVSSGSGDVKLFDTVEHMQADPDASEGDLAVVYREELTGVTEESEFDSCTFPNTVVLSEAFTGSISGRFRPVDSSSGYFDGNVSMSSSRFRFDGWGESSQIRVQYTSQDGITYTRTDGGEELQEFGTVIKFEAMMEPWNDVFGQFMKIGGNYFEGLYENKLYLDENELHWCDMQESIITDSDITPKFTEESIEPTYINDFIDKVRVLSRYDISDYPYLFITMNADKTKLHGYSIVNNESTYDEYQGVDFDISYYRGKMYQKCALSKKQSQQYLTKQKVLEYDISTGNITSSVYTEDLDIGTTSVYAYTEIKDRYILGEYNYKKDTNSIKFWFYHLSDNATAYNDLKYSTQINIPLSEKNKYFLTSTQLDITRDYVYEKIFYGKNGVENGILTTNVSNSFADVNAEVFAKLQQQYDNMQPRVLTDQDKEINTNIYFIPTNKNGEVLIDTSNVTNMNAMFKGCSNLTTIPLLDTSNVTNMGYMFYSCSNLTSIPLLDTSSVTNMYSIFTRCTSLTTIPLIDTSNVTNMNNMFADCTSLTTVPQLNTSSVTEMGGMFYDCSSLTTIPLIDTSSVTYMRSMFADCTSLTTVPQLNTSSVTGVYSMFDNCSALSNDSLNNILAMCTNATKVTSYKTLKGIGLTEAQANICKTLSNYSAFIAAGWTTGY